MTPQTKFRSDRRYAVLVDVGSEWPEVVFVGRNFELAEELVCDLDARGIGTSTQVTLTADEILGRETPVPTEAQLDLLDEAVA